MSREAHKRAMQEHVKIAGYAPHEPQDEGNRVVVLFERTGCCKLFEKLDTVGNWFSFDTYRHSVYVTPKQMSAKLSNKSMRKCIANMDRRAAKEAEELTGLDLAHLLWKTCQKYGNFVNREFPQGNNSESDSNKFVINLAAINSPEGKEKLAKQPKQCRVVAEGIWQEQQSVMSDDQMDSLGRRLLTSGKLKTKQDPVRIVRYYLPTLAELGMVEYRTRRVRDDSGGEEEGDDGMEN